MTDVWVAGAGMTRSGRRNELLRDLMAEAGLDALAAAGLEQPDAVGAGGGVGSAGGSTGQRARDCTGGQGNPAVTRASGLQEVKLDSWEHFDAEVARVFETFEQAKAHSELKGLFSDLLFRGQADSRWSLRTTLERFTAKPQSVSGYHRVVSIVARAVESHTGKHWAVVDDEVDESDLRPPPAYEFMIYLRHHGFPSPLLDWSRSPYVAAFFAFAQRPSIGVESVAIYAFREWIGQAKVWDEGSARIVGCGPTVATHERHYSQQCEYTICKKPRDGRYFYCDLEEAVDDRQGAQDVITKYIIPINERDRFLRKLDLMNISAYSLFRDEGSLMQTLAYRVIEWRGL